MSGDAQWLIEAIEKKQLIEFLDPLQKLRTGEPHVYALGAGAQEIVIVYQIDVGRGTVPNEQLWKIVEVSRVSVCEPIRRFAGTRSIPKQHVERVRKVFAQVSDAARNRKK